MRTPILALDVAGAPRKWITAEAAVIYYARSAVAYDVGAHTTEFRGGWQRCGARSRIRVSSIVALHGSEPVTRQFDRVPRLSNDKLFARDRHLCAYCGMQFRDRDLSRDHIVPLARGGGDTWMNLVTACRACNARKGSRAPEEAGMRLRYLPYVPSRWEDFILANRNILADQMAYLLARVPAHSRVHH